MTLLELVFESSGDYVQLTGVDEYRLYETDGHYHLPDVVLRSAPGAPPVEVRDVSVSMNPTAGAYGHLGSAILENWNAADSGRGWVAGRKELVAQAAIPAAFRGQALAAVDLPAEFVVSWHYVYTDANGVAAVNDTQVRLVFQPRGVAPGTWIPGPPSRPGPPYLPAILRQRSNRHYNGFAAVDFGTSSSVVAVYDARRVVPRSIDVGQAAYLRRDVALLLRDSPPPSLDQQWREQLEILVTDVSARLTGYYFADVVSLAEGLDGLAAAGRALGFVDPVLDAVCLALEQRVAECSPELARWLAPRLLACMDRAFTTPDLDEQQIREVAFDPGRDQREIPNAFKIVSTHPLEIDFGQEDGADDISRRLKAEMFESAPLSGVTDSDGRDATTDDLVAHVYYHLAARTEEFLRADEDAPLLPLAQLVVTYPTTTLPSDKKRLEELIRHSLSMDHVVADFDEGVAAGLFFLMRDFGSQRLEFGVEALRAKARQIGSDPPTWQQNMLVIDIGAGTTDIALIGLTMQDITKKGSGDPLVRGRHYLINPEVLNSTGHPQLGGNYLTLRVFYWLKAHILDALVTGPGIETARAALADRISKSLGPDAVGGLASMVANSGADAPAPPEVADILRANLPTHTRAEAGPPGEAFWRLWQIAEDAKIGIATSGEYYTIDSPRLLPLLRLIDAGKIPGLPELLPLLPMEGLLLPADGFETLVRPVLRQAAELAAWLVRTSFSGWPEARLDRVVLSGKTSRMPLLSNVVREVLSGDGDPGRRLPWNAAALVTETERAKQAAALGACWAQAFREHDAGGDESELDRGRTLVTFGVENLFRSLPCGFSQKLVAQQHKPLLRAGAKLTDMDGTGQLVARAAWERLVPTFEVHRPYGQMETIQWGVFRYYTRRDPDGFRPDPVIWGPGSSVIRGSRIMAQFEVDQGLNPYLNLCWGEPHYNVGVSPELAVSLRGEIAEDCWDSGEFRLQKLPAAVWMRGIGEDDLRDDEIELFPVWHPAEDDQPNAYFPVLFHTEDDVTGESVPGRIRVSLPPPSANGYYEFFLRWPDGHRSELWNPRVTGQLSYTATLDACGMLRLHRGEPPYWAARTLRDVEDRIGSVLRVQMDPGMSEFNPSWEPFGGKI